MKKKLSLLLVSIMLILTFCITGCSASVGTEMKNQSIRDVVEEHNLVNEDDVIDAFKDLRVTSTKANSVNMKNGTGNFKITSTDGDKFIVICEDYVAKEIRDEDENVVKNLADINTEDENTTTEDEVTTTEDDVINEPEDNITDEPIIDDTIDDDTTLVNSDYTPGPVASNSEIFKVFTDDNYDNDIEQTGRSSTSDYVTIYETNLTNVFFVTRLYTFDYETFSNGATSQDLLDVINDTYKSTNPNMCVNEDVVWDITESLIGTFERTEDEKAALLAQASAMVFEKESNDHLSYMNKVIYDGNNSTYYFFYETLLSSGDYEPHYIIVDSNNNIEKDGVDYTDTYNKLLMSLSDN